MYCKLCKKWQKGIPASWKEQNTGLGVPKDGFGFCPELEDVTFGNEGCLSTDRRKEDVNTR